MKNFINFDDFDREFVEDTIKIGIEEKNKLNSNKVEINFGKKFGVLLFEKPSLRTKLSFIKALLPIGQSTPLQALRVLAFVSSTFAWPTPPSRKGANFKNVNLP